MTGDEKADLRDAAIMVAIAAALVVVGGDAAPFNLLVAGAATLTAVFIAANTLGKRR